MREEGTVGLNARAARYSEKVPGRKVCTCQMQFVLICLYPPECTRRLVEILVPNVGPHAEIFEAMPWAAA